jgi:5-methylcytosine-specific restriction endonuclease McrA
VFAQTTRAVQALEQASRDLEPAVLEGRDAARLLDVVAQGERLCAAMKARLARRVDETRVSRAAGHRSAAHWVAERTGQTVGAATRALETVRALDDLPATAEAFRTGQLSEVQAAEITSAATDEPTAEKSLLEAASETNVKGLRDRCRQVRAGAQADDQAWARQLHVTRRAHEWHDPDGAYRIDARLAPDAGARFSSAWNSHIDRIFEEARRAGRREPRTAYAADALVAAVTEGPCKPTEVRVVVDNAALARGHTKDGERCEIAGAGPVPVHTARSLVADAAVTVMVREGDDITAVSRPTRTIPAKLRRAVEARYPTCCVNACSNDQFLEIDQVVAVEDHGRTEDANLWRICPHHHKLKTEAGRKVTGTAHDWDLVPPDDPHPP